MAARVQLREVSNEEGNRLLRIVRRGSGSVVTWRRAQMVLLSAQGMDAARIAEVTFTSPDRVRDVLHNFNTDGFDSLYPRYAGGRPPKFTLPQWQQIKAIALSRPDDHDLPFSVWSLAKLADFLVAEGVVDDISHEGLRALLRDEDVSFQAVKTWKASTDPDYPDRAAVHRAALLRPRRHWPRHPPRAGADDPPLHRLAERPQHRPAAPQGHQASLNHQEGEGCLTRH
jgi:transposase